ncbi:hypothetical protein [Bacillus albus]|uniref:hypothetical protein n=1 Tax=Bacillus albus TaxID=2026189 RepID=UPI0013EB2252|nr:hypothetical protein [Bacillus albus]
MDQSRNVSENKKVNTGDEKKSGSLTSVVAHLFATLIDKGVLTPEEVENIFKRI